MRLELRTALKTVVNEIRDSCEKLLQMTFSTPLPVSIHILHLKKLTVKNIYVPNMIMPIKYKLIEILTLVVKRLNTGQEKIDLIQ